MAPLFEADRLAIIGDALAQMAARLSWLAYDLRDEIVELDLDPVVVLPNGQGAFAVERVGDGALLHPGSL